MQITQIADLFQWVKKLGDGRYIARCPAHDDSSPSLSLRQAGDRVLVHCHAGCTFQQISDAVGLNPSEWFSDSEQKPERQPARPLRSIERQAFWNRVTADRNRLIELRNDLRRRDMLRLAISKAVRDGLLTENQAFPWLVPLANQYAELEHEFLQVLARSVDEDSFRDPLTPQRVDEWEQKVVAYLKAQSTRTA